MNFKKLGIVLFLLISVVGFSLSEVSAFDPAERSGFSHVQVQINGPTKAIGNFRSLDISTWTSFNYEKWTACQMRNRDPKLKRGENYTIYDMVTGHYYETYPDNLQIVFTLDIKNDPDQTITLRIKDYDGSLITADKITELEKDNSGYNSGKITYKGTIIDLSSKDYKYVNDPVITI
jgi:hypothetical protein